VEFAGNYNGPLYAPHPDLTEGLTDLQRRRYLGRRPGEEKERLKRANERKDKKAALAAMQKQYKGMKAGIYSSYEPEGEQVVERADTWHPDPEKDRKLGGPGANQRAREDRAAASKPKSDPKKLKKGESYMDYAKRQKKKPTYSPELQKRIDAAKAKKKEGVFGKIKRKLGLKKEEFALDERTRYAKETGKDYQTGKESKKGGTLGGDDRQSKVMRHMQKDLRKTGGLMSSRKKAIQPQGKKKEKGAKPKFKTEPTPVDKIKGKLARKRAPKPSIGSRFD